MHPWPFCVDADYYSAGLCFCLWESKSLLPFPDILTIFGTMWLDTFHLTLDLCYYDPHTFPVSFSFEYNLISISIMSQM